MNGRPATLEEIKEANIVLWHAVLTGNPRLGVRAKRGDSFTAIDSMPAPRVTSLEWTDWKVAEAGATVVSKFPPPTLREIVGNAPAFYAADRFEDVNRMWVRRDNDRWGAVNSSRSPYPVGDYTLQRIESIIDKGSIELLQYVPVGTRKDDE